MTTIAGRRPFIATGLLAGLLSGLAATEAAAQDAMAWHGFYGGLGVGGSYGSAEPDMDILYNGYFVDAAGESDRGQIEPLLNDSLSGVDAAGSLLLGYDHRVGDMTYGIEADVTLARFSESDGAGPLPYDTLPTESFTTRTTIESDVSVSLRPKIGLVAGDFHLHLAAGPSLSRFKTTHSFAEASGNAMTFSDSKTVLGLSTSIGAGYDMGGGWALRGDYVFAYFPEIVDGQADFAGDSLPEFSYDADFQSHSLRIALIRRF